MHDEISKNYCPNKEKSGLADYIRRQKGCSLPVVELSNRATLEDKTAEKTAH